MVCDLKEKKNGRVLGRDVRGHGDGVRVVGEN